MRTLDIQAGPYTATINTNNKVCEAFGKCFLNISFSSFATIPAKVKLLHGSHEFEKAVNSADVANIHAYFDLSWFKYFAPKFGTKGIKIEIKFDNYWVGEINYTLTAGRGEIIPRNSNNRLSWDYDWKPFVDEIIVVCPTQKTKHAQIIEEMVFLNSAEFDEGWFVDFDVFLKTDKAKIKLANGYNFQPLTIFDDNVDLSLIIENKDENISEIIGKFKAPKTNDCYDIEIRITNKYGLRGVMGGKIIDTSEGGDDVKSNVDIITYNGIFRYEKIGQKIQKEVYFDCGGDVGLLELLRDACVYGVAEWYDERTEQWLPCQVVDNSLDTDPFKEQSITFILQQL